MLGNFIKSVFALATVGLATVGGLTFVPDERGRLFPRRLRPPALFWQNTESRPASIGARSREST